MSGAVAEQRSAGARWGGVGEESCTVGVLGGCASWRGGAAFAPRTTSSSASQFATTSISRNRGEAGLSTLLSRPARCLPRSSRC